MQNVFVTAKNTKSRQRIQNIQKYKNIKKCKKHISYRFDMEKILVKHRKSLMFTRKVKRKKVKLLLNLIYVPLMWELLSWEIPYR